MLKSNGPAATHAMFDPPGQTLQLRKPTMSEVQVDGRLRLECQALGKFPRQSPEHSVEDWHQRILAKESEPPS
jgi:hypothetical protein